MFLQIGEDNIQNPVPSGGPASLLTSANLVPKGSFLLPTDGASHNGPAGTGFDFAYRGVAYYSAHNSLFIQGNNTYGWTAELAIPATSQGDVALPVATWLQDFHDTRVGQLHYVKAGGGYNAESVYPNGQFIYGGRLIGDSLIYYDATNLTRLSFYAHSLTLSDDSTFTGMVSLGNPAQQGFVAGYMAAIPADWQVRLGGPVFAGQTGLSIVNRQAFGPDALVFDPDDIGVLDPVPGNFVIYYDINHPTLGLWDVGVPVGSDFTQATEITGACFPVGTDTVLFFGRQGIGINCYGSSYGLTGVAPETITIGDDIEIFYPSCLGAGNGHGNNTRPYRYWVWAYNARDLELVKLGSVNPWDIFPYAVWPLELGGQDTLHNYLGGIQGVAYDPDTQTLYVSAQQADGPQPRVFVFTIDLAGPAHAVVEVPLHLFADAPESFLVNLTWDPVSGITNYLVSRNGKPLSHAYTESFTDVNITPSTTFTYTVQSVDALGRLSAASAPASATTHSIASAPTSPTTTSAPTGVHLTWGPSFDNFGVESFYYRVYRNRHPLGAHAEDYIPIVVTTLRAFTDTTAVVGITYIYLVYSLDRGLVLGQGVEAPTITYIP